MDIPWTKEQLMKANTKLLNENKLLKQGITNFVDKNFHGGAKADREDYSTMVSCKDIWDLRDLIK